ncbi:MAG TPA: DUF559 domain-containing protein [Solirubrobacterales bacterium]|nr:DUF559 domain-containing protein [Solirubrobacterales bacterium]
MDARRRVSPAELNRKLGQVVKSGHGVITGDDLREIGVSRQTIRRRKESGLLIPVLRDVFTLPGCRPDEIGRRKAAVHAGGSNCCLSHRSALAHHGLIYDQLPVHVLRTGGADRRNGSALKRSRDFGFSVLSHQTRNLPPDEITIIEGIRVATPERALLDFAATGRGSDIGKVLTQGERKGNLCWGRLESILENSRGRRGVTTLREEMDLFDPESVNSESDPEEDFLRMIRRRPLPMPLVNVWLAPYRVDFLWWHLMLIVELDPYGTHRGKRSFHGDRRKSVELETRGFRVIRLTEKDLYAFEERTARDLETIMEAQAALLGVSVWPAGQNAATR